LKIGPGVWHVFRMVAVVDQLLEEPEEIRDHQVADVHWR
jgi:hypothetical protein